MSQTRKPWQGVHVASSLQFNEDFSIDYDAFAEHVAFLAANGCDGIAPNGSLGEYQALSEEERARVITTAIDHAFRRTRFRSMSKELPSGCKSMLRMQPVGPQALASADVTSECTGTVRRKPKSLVRPTTLTCSRPSSSSVTTCPLRVSKRRTSSRTR